MPFNWHPEDPPPEIEAHSKAKLTVLRSYLRAYFDRLGANPHRDAFRLDLVDGFAGGGTFRDGDEIVSGTPLIMLEESEAAKSRLNRGRTKRLDFDFKYYFVDVATAHTDHLRKVLGERGYRMDGEGIVVRNCKFEDAVDDIISEVGRRQPRAGRSIFLLDQTGFSQVEMALVARIFQELPAAEVILTQARRRARDMLARIRAGGNPAEDIRKEKTAPTVAMLADEYLRRCDPYWKPSGRKTVRIYLKARILPTFGRMPVERVGPEDVAAWFDAVSRDRPGAANRAFEILRSMMFRAEECGFREPGTNPCLGIRKNPKRDIARFLDTGELARLGRALDAREREWPEAVAAIRLLALTGCRRGEVLDLRWCDIGEGAITLPDSKIGPRSVRLGEAARSVVDALPGPRDPDAFLFPKNAGRRSPHNIVACWRIVCEDAKLGRLRLHDLRHTAASHAVMAGETLPLVGKLLGHRRHETTAGYAHLADEHLVEAAEKVGSIIAQAMNLHSPTPPSSPRARRTYGRCI